MYLSYCVGGGDTYLFSMTSTCPACEIRSYMLPMYDRICRESNMNCVPGHFNINVLPLFLSNFEGDEETALVIVFDNRQ